MPVMKVLLPAKLYTYNRECNVRQLILDTNSLFIIIIDSSLYKRNQCMLWQQLSNPFYTLDQERYPNVASIRSLVLH